MYVLGLQLYTLYGVSHDCLLFFITISLCYEKRVILQYTNIQVRTAASVLWEILHKDMVERLL